MAKGRARLRVRAYHVTNRVLVQSLQVLRAVHAGAFLGLLDDDDLERLTLEAYADWPRYIDDDHTLSGLRPWEASAIAMAPGDRIIVVGAGGGREVIALAEAGASVDGYECTPELVEHGRGLITERGLDAELTLAPPSVIPGDPAPVDIVVIGWGAFMHVPSAQARRALLERCFELLLPGGRLVLSYFEQVPGDRGLALVFRTATVIRRLRAADPPTLGDDLEKSFDHHIDRAALVSELRDVGFTDVAPRPDPYPHATAVRPR